MQKLLKSLGFKDFEFKVNDRRILSAIASYCGFESNQHDALFIILDKLDKIQINGVKGELEKENFSQESSDKVISFLEKYLANEISLDNIVDILEGQIDTSIIDDLKLLIETTKAQSNGAYSASFDLTLVRGMGYYTGPIFEVKYKDYPGSIGGGGRYDKMIGRMLKKDVPACGISLGFERLMNIIEENNMSIGSQDDKVAILFDPKLDSINDVYAFANELRCSGKMISIIKKHKKFKKQLDKLKNDGFNFFVTVEQKELKPLQ